MDPLKMYFLSQMWMFHWYVSSPEGNFGDYTNPKTNSQFARENRQGPKRKWIVFQPSIIQVRAVSFRECGFFESEGGSKQVMCRVFEWCKEWLGCMFQSCFYFWLGTRWRPSIPPKALDMGIIDSLLCSKITNESMIFITNVHFNGVRNPTWIFRKIIFFLQLDFLYCFTDSFSVLPIPADSRWTSAFPRAIVALAHLRIPVWFWCTPPQRLSSCFPWRSAATIPVDDREVWISN